MKKNPLQGRSLISIEDLTKENILLILKRAEEIKKKKPKELLKGKILASCFFEPSTRTRLSFESAMLRLGGSVIGFSDLKNTSNTKGESLHDCMQVVGFYADILVIRHPSEGSARMASCATTKPVINAGDGANQHPTQTLLDLFTMKESFGKLKGLNVAVVGDLKYGRTVHSLSLACALFDMRLYFISAKELELPDEINYALKKSGAKFSFHRGIEDVLDKADVLYMTRLQKERFGHEKAEAGFCLKKDMLAKAKKSLKILHPLPRVDEIELSVDLTTHAHYFQQAENALYVRMALLSLILE